MKIREHKYTLDYLYSERIPFSKWGVLAENCFDTDYLEFINAVINAKVLFNTKIEEISYENTILELIDYRSKIIGQLRNNKVKRKKIHQYA